jgi:choline kinase
MIGMVLAAGAGRRLRPYTDELPKTLVPVDGERTVLDTALANFAKAGLTDVAIVTGYKAQAIEDRLGDLERTHGVTLETVFNDKAEEWNNAYSLWCARSLFQDGVVLCNGDTVAPLSVTETLLAASGRGDDLVLALDDHKTLTDESMKATVDETGQLQQLTKRMPNEAGLGEYIGLTLIEPIAHEILADALHWVWNEDPQLYYEDGFAELAKRGGRVGVQSIGAVEWTEVDDHADLERAREIACRC